MHPLLNFEKIGDIGVIKINSPPVNALGHLVRVAVFSGLEQAIADNAIKAIILKCAGKTFFAGADIAEFGKPFAAPDLVTLLKAIASSPKPIIAAIHGTALGGGLETALRCHYRVAASSAKFGLPEVHLGILPGAGGTQLLPRLVGVPDALDIICSGRNLNAKQALSLGIIDSIMNDTDLHDATLAFARVVIDAARPLPKIAEYDGRINEYRGEPEIFSEFLKKNARSFRGFKAPGHIVKAIQAAVELPFEEGMVRENELFFELMESTESAAQRYVFFAERLTSKVPGISASTPLRHVQSVGIIGAGTMGSGIAINFLNIGIPVTLLEQAQDSLNRGLSNIRGTYEQAVAKGRISAEDLAQKMDLLTPALDYSALADVDLVIEAVFESMAVKENVFSQLDKIAKPGAILATNTSFLDVNIIAATTSRPQDVIGLHFFSPANLMPLLEIVRGKATSPELIMTALDLAKRISKTPVLSGVCYGFIANRAMQERSLQADFLSLQGISPIDIDRVCYEYGFPMGPFQMIDLVGLDVMGRDSAEKTVMSELVRHNRLGQKNNSGYYDYDEKRKATVSSRAIEIIKEIAEERGIRTISLDDEEILARLLYPVINEGSKILEEGIAMRPSDIDIALIRGYNWPVYRGGPMFWANTIGLDKVVLKLEELEVQYGARFKPAALLKRLVGDGQNFQSF